MSTFDKANQDNVVKSLPSIIGAPSTNTGNSGNSNGNSGWNMGLKRKYFQRKILQYIIQELGVIFALTYCKNSISSEHSEEVITNKSSLEYRI